MDFSAIEDELPSLIDLRHDLHRHPELGLEEQRTSAVVARELEAARAYGMSPFTAFRRIWLPRAIHRALPTLSGETVLQLKATPLVATITVVDLYGVISRVRQATFLTYEPLLLLALIYMILTGILVVAFRWLEARVPVKGA